MTKQEILDSNISKTEKMKSLFELGCTRREVAELLNVSYGFVQNVYAKTYPERVRSRTILDLVSESVFTFDFNHKFGVEIEAHGIETPVLINALRAAGLHCQEDLRSRQINEWKVTRDGSLQGANTFELVSPILIGAEGLEQLRIACSVLKAKKAKINKTCGLHIHFDAEAFELSTWKKLYLNYGRLENTIDSFMAESRRGSNNYYCKTFTLDSNWENKVNRANELERIQKLLTNRSRYYKLNSESFWRHRTVEFRQHQGTIEFEKISNWITFLARLVEFSKSKQIESGDWESLKTFCNDDLINYLAERKQKLN